MSENEYMMVLITGKPASRKISIVLDDARTLQNSPSPPRHKVSDVLFISNLVRPFTVNQLKELLARTGSIVEGGFWIDKIKSKCYVQVCFNNNLLLCNHVFSSSTYFSIKVFAWSHGGFVYILSRYMVACMVLTLMYHTACH
jgi:hypothetical protein